MTFLTRMMMLGWLPCFRSSSLNRLAESEHYVAFEPFCRCHAGMRCLHWRMYRKALRPYFQVLHGQGARRNFHELLNRGSPAAKCYALEGLWTLGTTDLAQHVEQSKDFDTPIPVNGNTALGYTTARAALARLCHTQWKPEWLAQRKRPVAKDFLEPSYPAPLPAPPERMFSGLLLNKGHEDNGISRRYLVSYLMEDATRASSTELAPRVTALRELLLSHNVAIDETRIWEVLRSATHFHQGHFHRPMRAV